MIIHRHPNVDIFNLFTSHVSRKKGCWEFVEQYRNSQKTYAASTSILTSDSFSQHVKELRATARNSLAVTRRHLLSTVLIFISEAWYLWPAKMFYRYDCSYLCLRHTEIQHCISDSVIMTPKLKSQMGMTGCKRWEKESIKTCWYTLFYRNTINISCIKAYEKV